MAISILMVAVAAPITIAQKGLSSAVFSKDQMIASYLAQDAIEFIKNRRDVSTINNENFDWESFLTDFDDCLTTSPSGSCRIDTITVDGNIEPHSASINLNRDNDNGFYQYSSGDPTKFNREIEMTKNIIEGRVDEVLVTVTVSWGETDDKKLEVKALIYNY